MNRLLKSLCMSVFLIAGLLTACSPSPPHRELSPAPVVTSLEMAEESPSVEQALAQAESLTVIGARANKEQEWALAQRLFAEALIILATMDPDAEETDHLTERFDQLLVSLSVEYPKALQNVEELANESSLAMLLMKLGELRSDLTVAISESTVVEPVEKDSVAYDVPIHWNAQVENCLHFFQTENRHTFSTWLSRSGRYIPMMQRILREHDLPEDLVYLALIESGFNPHAYSWAHAAGPWQFISSTGKLYGLKQDWWLDERKDPYKSTRAAARYLKHLYEEFDSWPLALAGYNCGEQRVNSAIRKAGSTDFWKLSLPRQTRNFVPLFMAATVIAKAPERYGFSVEYEKPLEYDHVQIDECTDLKVVARCCGSSYDELKALNPELLRWCTPPNHPGYQLKIPQGTRQTFLRNYALVPASERITWQRHKIKRGETLSAIARQYGTSVSAIKEANSLRSSHRIFTGNYLLIPLSAYGDQVVFSSQSGTDAASRKLIYTVKKGDNLSRIAKDFGVSVSQLCRWNNLNARKNIYPGNKLNVYPSLGFGTSPGSAEGYAELIYTVRRGDTLWDIANDFGVTIASLIRENSLKDPSRIQPGKKLKIKMSTNL